MPQAHFIGVAALCALVASLIAAPTASAQRKHPRRSVDRCVAFEQADKDEVTLALTLRNGCSMPVDCSVSWQLVCAPESKTRRAVTPSSSTFSLATESSRATEVSAAACGDDSWMIRAVNWRCQPSKD